MNESKHWSSARALYPVRDSLSSHVEGTLMPQASPDGNLGELIARLTSASYQCFDRVVLYGHLMGLTRPGGLHNIFRNALRGILR